MLWPQGGWHETESDSLGRTANVSVARDSRFVQHSSETTQLGQNTTELTKPELNTREVTVMILSSPYSDVWGTNTAATFSTFSSLDSPTCTPQLIEASSGAAKTEVRTSAFSQKGAAAEQLQVLLLVQRSCQLLPRGVCATAFARAATRLSCLNQN